MTSEIERHGASSDVPAVIEGRVVARVPAEIEYVREVHDMTGEACLVQRGNDYFIVSSVDAFDSGPETLVFPADADGKVTSWLEVAGGRRYSRGEAIADLAARDLEDF